MDNDLITIIISSIACLIIGGIIGYILFRYIIKQKYQNSLLAAEKEAERLKQEKLLEVKTKFINKKAELEKEVEVNVTFPTEYHAEDLAGKEAVFKCTVHEIKVKELPELDDDFAAEVSEFDTLDEYKNDIKAKIKEQKIAENTHGAGKAADGGADGAALGIPGIFHKQAKQQICHSSSR